MKHFTREFLIFGFKQASAAIFGGILLLFILLTEFYYPLEGVMHKYDFMFLVAVITQALLVSFKMESWREVKIILIFHVVATIMEIFKTLPSIGSWAYPGAGDAIFSYGGVPMFTGFMYSAVGSYICRAWRNMDLQFDPYPAPSMTLLLAGLIYLNFFTHHYTVDIRYFLLAMSVVMFGRTVIHYKVSDTYYKMPFMVAGGLTAFFIWIAENISTFGSAWIYPNQLNGWALVSPQKIVSWYLLLLLSFGLVSLLYQRKKMPT